MYILRGYSAEGTPVYQNTDRVCHPHHPDLVEEGLAHMSIPARPNDPSEFTSVVTCYDAGRFLGYSALVECEDESLVFYERRGDRAYPSRMTTELPPVPCGKLTTVVRWDGYHWCLTTNWIGEANSCPEPGCAAFNMAEPEEKAEWASFWKTHALVKGYC